MRGDKRYSTSSGTCCAVTGCNNSDKKRFLWENEDCLKHIGKIKMFCKCPRPFKLFQFPDERSEPSKIRRMSWISNLKRKNYIPHKSSVVCSKHFVDGKPTNENPYPALKLGHELKILKQRKTKNSMKMIRTKNLPSDSDNKSSVVCSKHSVDGKPTNENPYPSLLKLGHELKIPKQTKTKISMRMIKPKMPTSENNVECDEHFMDGKPTNENPNAALKSGHELKIPWKERTRKKEQRKTKASIKMIKTENPPSPFDNIEDVAEFVEVDTEANDLLSCDDTVPCSASIPFPQNYTQLHSVLLVLPPPQAPTSNVKITKEHNYIRSKPKTCDQATQTSPSELINENNINFYTGLPSIDVFVTLTNLLKDFLPSSKFKNISVANQILLVLMRLRLGLLYEDIGHRFGINKDLVSNITKFWLKQISNRSDLLASYMPASLVQKSMPMKIRKRYQKLIKNCTILPTS